MVIKATDYIKTAFSVEDANQIKMKMDMVIEVHDNVTIDFSGITFFTTLFFSTAITCFVFSLGATRYDQIIRVTGLTEIGQTAYEHSLEFAREESLMTPEQIRAKIAAVDNELDEE